MEEIKIKSEFIKLDQFLKFSNVLQTGGMAKIFIQEECVLVNGEVCTMRGKKLYNGDIVDVEFYDENGKIEDVVKLKVVN